MPVAIDEPRLLGAPLARGLFGQDVGQERDRLDVDALPAIVGQRDDGEAFRGSSLVALEVEIAGSHYDARSRARRRKGMVAARHPARDLQIDEAVADPISPHAL